MIQTRTPEQIEARRARVAQMTAEGRVMTSTLRTRIANQQRKAQKLQDEASAEIRTVVSRMRDEGLTMRDIAVLLGVSPQRVAQLIG